jgi:hypothetical protein
MDSGKRARGTRSERGQGQNEVQFSFFSGPLISMPDCAGPAALYRVVEKVCSAPVGRGTWIVLDRSRGTTPFWQRVDAEQASPIDLIETYIANGFGIGVSVSIPPGEGRWPWRDQNLPLSSS